MRIGIDYTVGVYQGSGIGRYARGLVHALADLDHENEYTLLWARAPAPGGGELPRLDSAASFPGNVRARRLPLNNRVLTAAWQRLRLPLPIEAFSEAMQGRVWQRGSAQALVSLLRPVAALVRWGV